MVENGVKLNKEEVMQVYGLYERLYQSYLKEGLKKYPENQLKRIKRGLYYINKDLIPKIFQRKRRPNQRNNEWVKEYVLTQDVKFDYIGCIRPQSMTEKECEQVIKYLFKEITKNVYPNNMCLYYFIEKNNIQKKEISTQYHIHYLIQTDIESGFIQRARDVIKEYLGGNPFLQHYKDKWEVEGKRYSVKEVSKTSACGYLTYKKRKK